MRRLRSIRQSILAFVVQVARGTLRDARAVGNALTSHAARTIFGLLLLIAAFPIVGLFLWPFLLRTMRPSDFDERKEVLVLLVQGLALLGGAAALLFTWLRLRAAERTIQVSQEGQITERFTRAIQQLGDPKLEVQLGGIYALERIARDSSRDHGTIMEVLTAYVRENAPWKDSPALAQPVGRLRAPAQRDDFAPPTPAVEPRTDIQAILTVIGRRSEKARKEERKNNSVLDLRGTDLRGADLTNAYMEQAWLMNAHMEMSNLGDAHMEGANLWIAHLEWAWLRGAHMEMSNLSGAHMEGAYLLSAHMEGAIGLTREQVDSAITDKDTILPDYLKEQGSVPPSP